MFNEKDIAQIQAEGLTVDVIEKQLDRFRNGFPYLQVIKAATKDDGISVLSEDKKTDYFDMYRKDKKNLKLMKFVPASGAATRMFKNLFGYLASDSDEPDEFIQTFIDRLEDFAFYGSLKEKLKEDNKDIIELKSKGAYKEIISALLEEKGLNYGKLPKGLLEFHNYEKGARTPFEEHIVEGIEYARDDKGNVNIHFTISEEHLKPFQELVDELKEKYENDKVELNITFSFQKRSTNTIAVTPGNEPFREDSGEILFRPGGHGALLDNLNDLDADLIFIKNIDNVVPDRIKEPTFYNKQVLAGIALEIREKIYTLAARLQASDDTNLIAETEEFFNSWDILKFPDDYKSFSPEAKKRFLQSKLNRPIRICGMVKSDSDTGGGPFWAVNKDGSASPQIVETAQFNPEDQSQVSLIDTATHFNPVDIVCITKDYNGNYFDLHKFKDPDTGFISNKSKNGRELKALELPGLWNGGMSDWNTIFVEVPLITFNPVKTVNDLLKEEHQ